MAVKTIADFKSALAGGGARPNLFEVTLANLPPAAGASGWNADSFAYMCKAAALPASNIASIDVPFRGRIFKVAGDRTFDTWTVTVINDESFILRNAFEVWMDGISKLDNALGATSPASYMINAQVKQFGRGSTAGSTTNAGTDPVILKTYEFQSIFPINISAIDLSYDSSDTIEEFTVEFAVQSWRVVAGAG